MKRSRHLFWFSCGAIVLLLPFIVGCDADTVVAAGPTPTPKPKPPKCQQDENSRTIAGHLLLSRNQNHYNHIVQDPSKGAKPLITDGVMAMNSFEDTGPVVYHPKNERFAFIGVSGGKTYVLEYNNGALYPNIAYPIHAASRDKWVCYTQSGKYLVTLAQNGNKAWVLLVHDEETRSDFREIPLAGEPSNLEIEGRNAQGREGFRYEIEMNEMGLTQEIRNWFK